jgi:hypothetical protein
MFGNNMCCAILVIGSLTPLSQINQKWLTLDVEKRVLDHQTRRDRTRDETRNRRMLTLSQSHLKMRARQMKSQQKTHQKHLNPLQVTMMKSMSRKKRQTKEDKTKVAGRLTLCY